MFKSVYYTWCNHGAYTIYSPVYGDFGAILVQIWCRKSWCKHGAKKESRLFGAAFLLFVKFIEPERAEAVGDHVRRMQAGAVGGGDQASA